MLKIIKAMTDNEKHHTAMRTQICRLTKCSGWHWIGSCSYKNHHRASRSTHVCVCDGGLVFNAMGYHCKLPQIRKKKVRYICAYMPECMYLCVFTYIQLPVGMQSSTFMNSSTNCGSKIFQNKKSVQ